MKPAGTQCAAAVAAVLAAIKAESAAPIPVIQTGTSALLHNRLPAMSFTNVETSHGALTATERVQIAQPLSGQLSDTEHTSGSNTLLSRQSHIEKQKLNENPTNDGAVSNIEVLEQRMNPISPYSVVDSLSKTIGSRTSQLSTEGSKLSDVTSLDTGVKSSADSLSELSSSATHEQVATRYHASDPMLSSNLGRMSGLSNFAQQTGATGGAPARLYIRKTGRPKGRKTGQGVAAELLKLSKEDLGFLKEHENQPLWFIKGVDTQKLAKLRTKRNAENSRVRKNLVRSERGPEDREIDRLLQKRRRKKGGLGTEEAEKLKRLKEWKQAQWSGPGVKKQGTGPVKPEHTSESLYSSVSSPPSRASSTVDFESQASQPKQSLYQAQSHAAPASPDWNSLLDAFDGAEDPHLFDKFPPFSKTHHSESVGSSSQPASAPSPNPISRSHEQLQGSSADHNQHSKLDTASDEDYWM